MKRVGRDQKTAVNDAPTVAAMQVTLAAAMMLVATPLILSSTPFVPSPLVLIAVGVLGVFGSGIAYIWNTTIVQAWGATPASTVTYISPLVGVLLGILVLGEHLTWSHPVGGVITIVGIFISQRATVRAHAPVREQRPVG